MFLIVGELGLTGEWGYELEERTRIGGLDCSGGDQFLEQKCEPAFLGRRESGPLAARD